MFKLQIYYGIFLPCSFFPSSANGAVATTHPDASIAAAFGNRFAIPLDFEILARFTR